MVRIISFNRILVTERTECGHDSMTFRLCVYSDVSAYMAHINFWVRWLVNCACVAILTVTNKINNRQIAMNKHNETTQHM